MEFINRPLWWYADSTDKQGRLAFNNDIDKFGELTIRVVFLGKKRVSVLVPVNMDVRRHTFVFLALPPTCGINRSTPNGAFLSSKWLFNSSMDPCRNLGPWRTPPMTPIPPPNPDQIEDWNSRRVRYPNW